MNDKEKVLFRRFVLVGIAILLGVSFAGFLAGCGVGSAPSHSAPKIADGLPSSFDPNYLNEIAPARWNKKTITYCITRGGHSSVPGVDIPKALLAGFNYWGKAQENVAYPVKWERIDDAANADITVAFVEKGELAANQLGSTEVYTGADNYITKADMKINKSLLPTRIKAVAAHEFGHALFCRGHSRDNGDIMYPTVRSGPASLRDINTASSLYNFQEPQVPAGRILYGGLDQCKLMGEPSDFGE